MRLQPHADLPQFLPHVDCRVGLRIDSDVRLGNDVSLSPEQGYGDKCGAGGNRSRGGRSSFCNVLSCSVLFCMRPFAIFLRLAIFASNRICDVFATSPSFLITGFASPTARLAYLFGS